MKSENRLKYIDVALRLNNIELHKDLLIKVINIIDIVDKKGGKATTKDILL